MSQAVSFPLSRDDYRDALKVVVFHPISILSMLAIAALLSVLGPFGTYTEIDMPMRLIFWLLACFGNGWAAVACLWVCTHFKPEYRSIGELSILVIAASLLNTLPGGLTISGLNLLFIEGYQISASGMVSSGLYVALLTVLLVSGFMAVMLLAPQTNRDAFDQRIPEPIAGELLALSIEDHYLRVQTSNGQSLIHCSMKTALSELSAQRGRQVHRSHWVASKAVQSAERKDGQWVLSLKNGVTIPVSRAYAAELRNAGWLKKAQ